MSTTGQMPLQQKPSSPTTSDANPLTTNAPNTPTHHLQDAPLAPNLPFPHPQLTSPQTPPKPGLHNRCCPRTLHIPYPNALLHTITYTPLYVPHPIGETAAEHARRTAWDTDEMCPTPAAGVSAGMTAAVAKRLVEVLMEQNAGTLAKAVFRALAAGCGQGTGVGADGLRAAHGVGVERGPPSQPDGQCGIWTQTPRQAPPQKQTSSQTQSRTQSRRPHPKSNRYFDHRTPKAKTEAKTSTKRKRADDDNCSAMPIIPPPQHIPDVPTGPEIQVRVQITDPILKDSTEPAATALTPHGAPSAPCAMRQCDDAVGRETVLTSGEVAVPAPEGVDGQREGGRQGETAALERRGRTGASVQCGGRLSSGQGKRMKRRERRARTGQMGEVQKQKQKRKGRFWW